MGIPVLCSYSKMLLQEHFDVPKDLDVHVGDRVVLNTRRGMEVGRVVAEPGSTKMKRSENTAGGVVRRATPEDRQQREEDLLRIAVSPELKTARRLAREYGLKMEFHDTESMLDGNKMVFYFTADQRIDFRELVRQMAHELDRKIELRQVSARDVARLVGDVGSCGAELCCKSFLVDFVPVSMKMAKNQGISLETAKVSGMCGRLKCCLKYEDDLYTMLRTTMPQSGQPVKSGNDDGWVCGVNLLTQTVTVVFDTRREELPVSAIEFNPKMTEREIREWQRAMRENRALEREKRDAERAERDARRDAKRSQAKAAVQEAIDNLPLDDSDVDAATSGEASAAAAPAENRPQRPDRGERRGGREEGGRNRGRSRRRGESGPRKSDAAGQNATVGDQGSQASQRPHRERQSRAEAGGEGSGTANQDAAPNDNAQSDSPAGEGGERRRSRRPRGRGGRSRRGSGGGGAGGSASDGGGGSDGASSGGGEG